jgi:hypothetical protein
MESIIELLLREKHRLLGKNNEIVSLIGNNQLLFDELFYGLFCNDKKIRGVCALAIYKNLCAYPSLIKKHRTKVLAGICSTTSSEAKWCLSLLVSPFKLSQAEKKRVSKFLFKWMNDKTARGTQVACMQSLAMFARPDRKFREFFIDEMLRVMQNGAPAVQARGRHLLADFEKIYNKKR